MFRPNSRKFSLNILLRQFNNREGTKTRPFSSDKNIRISSTSSKSTSPRQVSDNDKTTLPFGETSVNKGSPQIQDSNVNPPKELPSARTRFPSGMLNASGLAYTGTISSKSPVLTSLLQEMKLQEKKNHIIYIQASLNNTHVTLAFDNKVLISQSAGNVGFKKSQRGGYEAAHQVAMSVIGKAREKNLQIKEIEIVLKGFGPGREAAFKAINNVREWIPKKLTDATPIPFNGPRPKKARRI